MTFNKKYCALFLAVLATLSIGAKAIDTSSEQEEDSGISNGDYSNGDVDPYDDGNYNSYSQAAVDELTSEEEPSISLKGLMFSSDLLGIPKDLMRVHARSEGDFDLGTVDKSFVEVVREKFWSKVEISPIEHFKTNEDVYKFFIAIRVLQATDPSKRTKWQSQLIDLVDRSVVNIDCLNREYLYPHDLCVIGENATMFSKIMEADANSDTFLKLFSENANVRQLLFTFPALKHKMFGIAPLPPREEFNIVSAEGDSFKVKKFQGFAQSPVTMYKTQHELTQLVESDAQSKGETEKVVHEKIHKHICTGFKLPPGMHLVDGEYLRKVWVVEYNRGMKSAVHFLRGMHLLLMELKTTQPAFYRAVVIALKRQRDASVSDSTDEEESMGRHNPCNDVVSDDIKASIDEKSNEISALVQKATKDVVDITYNKINYLQSEIDELSVEHSKCFGNDYKYTVPDNLFADKYHHFKTSDYLFNMLIDDWDMKAAKVDAAIYSEFRPIVYLETSLRGDWKGHHICPEVFMGNHANLDSSLLPSPVYESMPHYV